MYQTMDKRPKVPKIHMFKTSDLMPPMMLKHCGKVYFSLFPWEHLLSKKESILYKTMTFVLWFFYVRTMNLLFDELLCITVIHHHLTSMYSFCRSSRLEKTHSGSNLAAFTPRYLWIRIALFEKRLQQIVVYLVSQSDK